MAQIKMQKPYRCHLSLRRIVGLSHRQEFGPGIFVDLLHSIAYKPSVVSNTFA